MTLDHAVKVAARARGVWADCDPRPTEVWIFRDVEGRLSISGRNMPGPIVHVDAVTAALWLLCIDLPDTSEKCPACERRGESWEQIEVDNDDWPDGTDWKAVPHSANALTGTTTWERPCQTCGPRIPCSTCNGTGSIPRPRTGRPGGAAADPSCSDCAGEGERIGEPTGRVPRSWGAVLLGAMPRPAVEWHDFVDDGAGRHQVKFWDPPEPGNVPDREALAVKADELEARGDPLGPWLNLWLAGDSATCKHCYGIGDGSKFGGPGPCTRCEGTGLEVAAALRQGFPVGMAAAGVRGAAW